MPDYAFNKLYISGDKSEISKIIQDKFQLKNTVPPPEEIKQKVNNEPNNWFCINWGVKHDVDNCIIKESNGRTKIKFDSPYSPPIPWLKKVSGLFPTLEFELIWMETEYPVCGFVKAKSGNIEGVQYKEGPEAKNFMKDNFTGVWESNNELEGSDDDDDDKSEEEPEEESVKIIIGNDYCDKNKSNLDILEKSMKNLDIIIKNKLNRLSKEELKFFIECLITANMH